MRKEACQIFTLRGFLEVLVGGIALFVWGSVLPFYNNSLNGFSNEPEVRNVIAANVGKSGTYFLPDLPALPADASEEERSAAMKTMGERMMGGSLVFAHARAGVLGSRTMIAAAVGTTVFVMTSLPAWNWYGTGPDHVLAEAIDQVLGAGIAGLVIAKLLPAAEAKKN